ncbi:hypothetical protein [Myroides sp.]|uniref:hypothetical protein n=1 Tax=Myroides sp. TaxID=1874736 RepID=UPI003F3E0D7D
MSIHDKEDILYKEFIEHFKSYSEEDSLCFDGLCYNGELYNEDRNCKKGNEEELWERSKRRILFLMKDPNNNPGQDYREWGWSSFTHSTFKIMFAWLKGLSTITKTDYLVLEQAYQKYDTAYPLAILNIKKASGLSNVTNIKIWEYAERDHVLLRKQIRDILQPNIIVCGGGSGTVIEVAKTFVYNDLDFIQVNSWCYYNSENNILLIDSWHPTARLSHSQKYDNMMKHVQEFMNLYPNAF